MKRYANPPLPTFVLRTSSNTLSQRGAFFGIIPGPHTAATFFLLKTCTAFLSQPFCGCASSSINARISPCAFFAPMSRLSAGRGTFLVGIIFKNLYYFNKALSDSEDSLGKTITSKCLNVWCSNAGKFSSSNVSESFRSGIITETNGCFIQQLYSFLDCNSAEYGLGKKELAYR